QQQKAKKSAAGNCLIGCLGVIVVGVICIVAFIAFIIFLFWEDEPMQDGHQGGGYEQEYSQEYSQESDDWGWDDWEEEPQEDSYLDSWGEVEQTGEGVYGESLALTSVRSQYTSVYGDGSDVHTIMVYMIGSDLETYGGSASDDIKEMMAADLGDQVNVIIMTGGTDEWWMSQISSSTCQYWQVKNGQLVSVNDNLGMLNMTSESTLTQFINDTASAFPANRYSLIMWDHGGGTFSGFGYDENYPNDTLTLENIGNALGSANVQFDIVGFDACLMATVETAFMLEPYADYMLASPETEPSTGWYYTDFLSELSSNPSMSTVELGVNVIDDYVETSEEEMKRPEATLSIVELRQVPYMYEVMCEYFTEAESVIESQDYATISVARSEVKDYGESEYEQIDAVDFVERAGIEGGDEVLEAISNAVIYYNNSSDMYDSHGLALYFPYDYPRYYTDIQTIMQNLGYTDAYMSFFDQFISVMTTAQMGHGRSTGGSDDMDYTTQDWYNSDVADSYEGSGIFANTELEIVEQGDGFVLELTDEEWEQLIMIELQVLLDDGEGYVDLGSDNMYDSDRDGNLLIEFDYTWVTLDGHTVPFYAEFEYVDDYDDTWYTYGRVPALLNGTQEVEVVVYWDDENPYGYVAGYRIASENTVPTAKGLFQLEQGDVLEWIFDYYTYDIVYEGSYIMGDSYTVPSSEIEVSYDDVGDMDSYVYFQLTDIYNNIYYTEAIVYTD
ncbi:MAG: clostripain-related cysteine peptidase, partial [Eubacteriales bacterium]